MIKLKILFLFAALFFLSSCSLFSPLQTPQTKSYLLNTMPEVQTKKHTKNITLLFTMPDTRPIYNTTQMAYTNQPFQISYFGVNQWAETPAQMLLPLMQQTLQSTHYFKAVVTTPYVGHYNYLISTQILKLQQNLMGARSRVELSVRIQIISVTTSQVVAIKQFNITVPMRQRTPFSGVVAANQATEEFLQQMVMFIVRNV